MIFGGTVLVIVKSCGIGFLFNSCSDHVILTNDLHLYAPGIDSDCINHTLVVSVRIVDTTYL
jgi:hypothetical protein